MNRPDLLVFDVNETLSDLTPLRARFTSLGVAEEVATTWFASVLRDGFALTSLGESAPFADLGAAALRTLVPGCTDDDVAGVLATFTALEVHPDVTPGVRALAALGIELVTLSNGAAAVADSLLRRAGLSDSFARLLSVEDVGVWKPAGAAYRHALDVCGVDPDRAALVAVHPWDIHGAARAGLGTVYLDRRRTPYPAFFASPDLTVESLEELATAL